MRSIHCLLAVAFVAMTFGFAGCTPEPDVGAGVGDADAEVVADADVPMDADEVVDADEVGVPDAESDGDVDEGPDRREELAQCLTDSGAVLYTTGWCSYCYLQKRLFGEYQVLLTIVDCWDYDAWAQTEECNEAGIVSYPTWIFGDGTVVEGMMNLDDLAEYAGCPWE